jgi:hypothetical protein
LRELSRRPNTETNRQSSFLHLACWLATSTSCKRQSRAVSASDFCPRSVASRTSAHDA